jgi:hypothetical protein
MVKIEVVAEEERVPEIAPPLNVRLAGSEPAVTDHVNPEPEPPVADNGVFG